MKVHLKSIYLASIALFAMGCSKNYEETQNLNEAEISEDLSVLKVSASRFYTPPNAAVRNNKKNLVTDFGANNSDSNDDSDKLNNAIRNLSNNGGVLTIPKGTYYFNKIRMRSNVHLEIEKGTVIFPTKGLTPAKNHRIFDFANKTEDKIKTQQNLNMPLNDRNFYRLPPQTSFRQ
ncbi:glycosyl hydrolase family 28-related protein [Cellulophaga sp. L1A9]|uniref:glycosyl hydrolase family 28-related protein n=1 Tax=Cellulophaga sp. L1A9 TaxID=2686362 RepID=UPI001E4B467B|nr:glycosyl hydrolase family 28-related protein [Cellulophaga sp. L1A9]